MKYLDQSAEELRLNFIKGFFDKALLNVITEDDLKLADMKIEAGIIGASHFVSLIFNDTKISEVFACIELPKSDGTRSVSKVSESNGSVKCFENNLYDYEFTSNILDWNNESSAKYEDFGKKTKSASDEDKSIGLSYTFPSDANDKFLAKTEVIVYLDDNNVVVETLHAYPNEEKLVFTKSKISINKEKK